MYPSSVSSPTSRKRQAPGASPIVPITVPPMQQQQQQPYGTAQPDQLLRWNGAAVEGNPYADAAARTTGVNPYGVLSPAVGQYGQGIQAPTSTTLARRGMNSALVPTVPRPSPFESPPESWSNFGDDGYMPLQPQQLQQPPTSGTVDDNDSIEALEERALRAKKEAMNKRKQIPPFVQKLSSFLDESKNTDLIRWSDSGDSFIVIDEDEFAKKLIPELFKHNNYASFVRQLNMYGFHKRVGLSDNSMKASERKNKSPSEYYNPYFKRGHPNLLWLINKPKSGNKAGGSGNAKKQASMGKREDGEGDSEEDGVVDETFMAPNYTNTNNQVGSRAGGPVDLGTLPKKDLVQVKTQLDKLQQQQVAISQLIERLRRDHNTLLNQAVAFQNMHDRHENSINAILNFLANVFRKSLEEQGGAQTVQDLLASIIPGNPAQMPQPGSVVDLTDFVPAHHQRSQDAQNAGTPKRAQRLLPPIPVLGKVSAPSPSPSSGSSSTTATHPPYQIPQMGSVTELFDPSPSEPTTPGSAFIKNELQTHPQEGMMRIINDTNATNAQNAAGGSSGLDLPDMAAKTSATMSHEQRNKMLNIMAGNASSGGAHVPQMQADQATKIQELSSLLGPLSPIRHVSGLDEGGATNGYFDAANVDMDQYLDAGAFNDLTSFGNLGGQVTSSTDGNDFNFNLDGEAGGGGGGAAGDFLSAGAPGGGDLDHLGFDSGRVLDMGSGNNTPSPAGTEEIPRHDLESPPGAKRRRVQ